MMHQLFPTPVFEENVGVPEGTLSVFDTIFPWDRFETKSISQTKQILSRLPEVQELILNQVKDWMYNALLVDPSNEIEIVRSWGVFHRQGDSCDWHSHSNAIMSGVYYIMCDEESGRLFFNKGAQFLNCFVPTLEPDVVGFTDCTAKQFTIYPEPGTLVMFPAQLVHRAEVCHSEKRLCIAFDVIVRGRIGSRHGNELEL